MQNILITGCSSGIGLATAVHFARLGWQVFASARNPDGADELRAAVASRLPISVIRIDVTEDESVERGVAEVFEKAGQLDVLVNNAGIGGGGPVELNPLDRAHRVFETNYFGAVRMIRAVLPGMRAEKSGAIVNITSMAGRVALAAHSHYCASKHALEGLSEGLAQEVLPFGIRVAIIEPGVILTPIFRKRSNKADYAPYETPVRRLGQLFQTQLRNPTLPEAVARTIEEAVTTDRPRLRYTVGADAERILRARAKMADEEWIAVNTIEDDEACFDALAAALGADLYR